MSVATPVSLEQYFANETKPASEYVNGELIQKSMPSNLHSELQVWLSYLLLRALGFARNRVKSEQNVRLSHSVVRVPDICIVQPNSPAVGQAIIEPPLLCVEILSPSDRLSETVKKGQDYLRWGVPSCWILNPDTQEAWTVYMNGIEPVQADEMLHAGEITIAMTDVFSKEPLTAAQ